MGRLGVGGVYRLASVVSFVYVYTAHGVSPSFRGLHPLDEAYFDSKVVRCKDGANSFTVDRVNDDFCDCVDGTDEPGTSACPRGKFYCLNAGSVPRFLYSSRVNDHICDCCDGSDEYDGAIHCPNTCIMGGNLEFKAEYHPHSTSGRLDTIHEKVNKPAKKLEDVVHNVLGLKLLAIMQLAFLVVVFAFYFLHRRNKSRRGRFRPEGYS